MSTSLLEVADQTSSVPTVRIRPAAPNSTQSSRGTVTRLRAIESRLDRQDGHRSSPFLEPLVLGGRIDPSRAKVGSRAGGVVPAIAAFLG